MVTLPVGPVGAPDRRGGGNALRVSWHGEDRRVVLSHWHDNVCRSSVQIGIEDLPAVIEVMVGALAECAMSPAGEKATADDGGPGGGFSGWVRRLTTTLRGDVASVIHLSKRWPTPPTGSRMEGGASRVPA